MKKNTIMKRLFAIFMSIVIMTLESVVVFAQPMSPPVEKKDLESIVDEFRECFSNTGMTRSILNEDIEYKANQFLAEYEQSIMNTGYQPHIIYADNYEQQQEELKTNFESMGLSKEGVYLILIGDQNISRESTSYSFNYTYNGTTYSLRRLSITAADDSFFSKASTYNVLKSSSATLIENCLNTAIISYISSISTTLGTVASICGLNVSMFSSAASSTLNLNCGTNWTRVFTQVYSENSGGWVSGSCVEYAKVQSYMSGYYYEASSNSMVAVPQDESSSTLYSSNYNNNTWKNQQAIIYVNNCNGVNYNTTGDVKYSYGGKVVVTHREDF